MSDSTTQFESLFWENVFAYLDILFVFFLIIWLTVLVWVLKDSLARSKKLSFHIAAILLVTLLTPILWLPIYLAIRPINYSQDRSTARSMLMSMTSTCEECGTKNSHTYEYCYCCGSHLHKSCESCTKMISKDHEYCHYCWWQEGQFRIHHEKKETHEVQSTNETYNI